jgi:hypothetical protein
MIRPEQIPDEVIKAAISAYDYASSDVYTTAEQDMATAIAAALNAWPGRALAGYAGETCHILPLPQEKSDGK